MSNKLFMGALLLAGLVSSCDLFQQPAVSNGQVAVTLEWKRPVVAQSYRNMLLDGTTMYRDERIVNGTSGDTLKKINLRDGSSTVFIRMDLYSYICCSPEWSESEIFLFTYLPPALRIYDRCTGTHKKTVYFTDDPGGHIEPDNQDFMFKYEPGYVFSLIGTKVYWVHGDQYFIDLETDLHETGTAGVYWANPRKVFEVPNVIVDDRPELVDGQLLLSYVKDALYPDNHGTILSIDPQTHAVNWSLQLDYPVGYCRKNFWKYGDFYIMSTANALTAFSPNGELRYSALLSRVGTAGAWISGNRLYTTCRLASSTRINGGETITCMNLDTGQRVWSYQYQYSMGQNPVEHNGVLYVPGPVSLMFFNAATGAYLGESRQITGDSQSANRNYVVEYDGAKHLIINGFDFVASVKMDLSINSSGQLVR